MVISSMDKNVYLFSGEGYMVRAGLKKLRESLDIEFDELNVMMYGSMPGADELIEACAAVPFLSPLRLVAVTDCTVLTATGSKEEAKRIADSLDRLPDSTVLVLCTPDAPDKRRALYKRISEIGTIREYAIPGPGECAAFVAAQAKTHGARIGTAAAQKLVSVVGYDYYALENEVTKLAVYSAFGEITAAHVAACVSRSLEYNVFEIHRLFVNRQAAQAQAMLDDLLTDERPEMLIGLFARKIRDMYKVKAMLDARYGLGKIATMLNMKSYPVQMLAKECARFSQNELRHAQVALADLDYGIKSGLKDAGLALPEVLINIYKL